MLNNVLISMPNLADWDIDRELTNIGGRGGGVIEFGMKFRDAIFCFYSINIRCDYIDFCVAILFFFYSLNIRRQ